MRIGVNPAKQNIELEQPFTHRVLVPIYIPNLEGYHAHSFKVLQMCLESLIKTVHEKTAITLINNACCEEITAYLRSLKQSGHIDQLMENNRNIGKIDSLFNLLKGTYEPLITITDADVLFMNDWQQQVEQSFQQYPELGMLCPTPIPDNTFYFTSATFWKGWFSNKLSFSANVDQEGMRLFALSIGKEGNDLEDTLARNKMKLCYQKKGKIPLCVGAGHFVATLRKEALALVPNEPSGKTILGNSEIRYIDEPVDAAGFVRASLTKAYAYHMGNVPEAWMEEKSRALSKCNHSFTELNNHDASKVRYWLRRKIIHLMKRHYPSCR